MADRLPRRRYPCAECPFRRDTEPGQFPACRYEALRATAGAPGAEVPPGAPVFACHMSTEGRDQACAGWLAVCGIEHIGMRIAVLAGRLEPEDLRPGDGWPELFGSYDEMAAVQGRDTSATARGDTGI
jgi:Family of unknown function (DUF6283)